MTFLPKPGSIWRPTRLRSSTTSSIVKIWVAGILVVLAPLSVAVAETPFAFVLTSDQVVTPVVSTASGRAIATLNTEATAVELVVQHDVSTPTAATLHVGTWGIDGPVVQVLESADSPIVHTWLLSPEEVADLVAGRVYLSIASAEHPDGEIRGQIAPNPAPQPGDVIISEIMYRPASAAAGVAPASEWVELFNVTDTDIDIGGWHFYDEDVDESAPCAPQSSGTIPAFILRAHAVVVVIPDGADPLRPTVVDFKSAWDLGAEHAVLQLQSDGATGGALTAGGLDDNPVDDGDDANDLPAITTQWQPCDPAGETRGDNEILVLSDGAQIIDVVNFGAAPNELEITDWPPNTPDGSITLIPGDYPAVPPTDVTTYSAAGNDEGRHWAAHRVGDIAGGVRQVRAAGVYGGRDVGSPGYLYAATTGNRRPVAFARQELIGPHERRNLTLTGMDLTRPFFGILMFVVKSLPSHGRLYDATTGRQLTVADLQGIGHIISKSPFDTLRYENDGTCAADGFTFTAYDGLLESPVTRVDLFVQCGGVAITEIMYAPQAGGAVGGAAEWVELFNHGTAPVNLAGWYLADGAHRGGALPAFVLGAQAGVTVVPRSVSVDEFRAAWCAAAEEDTAAPTGGSCPVIQATAVGEVSGAGTGGGIVGAELDDFEGTVRVHAPSTLVDAVVYRNGVSDAAWPVLTSSGPSIYLHSAEYFDAFGNDAPSAWAASAVNVDGAYAVIPTEPFGGGDTGSPAYLPGVAQGACTAGGPAFDGNQDGQLDLRDAAQFTLCRQGPGVTPPQNCGCFDSDWDLDVDLLDFAGFQRDY